MDGNGTLIEAVFGFFDYFLSNTPKIKNFAAKNVKF